MKATKIINNHAGLIADLKHSNDPFMLSEAFYHSIEYEKTERYLYNLSKRIDTADVDCLSIDDMQEPLTQTEIDLLMQQKLS